MKIGIISMQRIVNFGSFLQAYSLKKVLESYGHEIVFLDYKPGRVLGEKRSILHRLHSIKSSVLMSTVGYGFRVSIYGLLSTLVPRLTARHRALAMGYEMHIRYPQYLARYLGIKNRRYATREEIDLLIIGSDEVFNCLQNNPRVGYSPDLFGKNVKAGTKATYAASFGNTTYDRLSRSVVLDEVTSFLKDFSYFSARDANSVGLIGKLSAKQVDKNIDPVLLYDFGSEMQATMPKAKLLGEYMVVYAYPGRLTADEREVISKYAADNLLKIVSLGAYLPFADYNLSVDPFSVMAYVWGARYVITDTFHGTIYSIKANVQFATIVRKSHNGTYGNEEKLVDLLKTFSLEAQQVGSSKDIPVVLNKAIDFTDTNEALQSEQENAHKYLKKVLDNV